MKPSPLNKERVKEFCFSILDASYDDKMTTTKIACMLNSKVFYEENIFHVQINAISDSYVISAKLFQVFIAASQSKLEYLFRQRF